YELDPDANSGLNYQYHDVVRKKGDRKALPAGDCIDCRNYYEAVGPMPPRLQPPLWDLPPSPSQHDHRHHHHHPHHRFKNGGRVETSRPLADDDIDLAEFNEHQRRRDIATHKQAISRHRAQWQGSKDPPGYWMIGFPNTQEVAKINAEADEMRREKEEQVRREAR
ncbi:hypothetical protein K488DRAFT_49898, partial [Vararia minispora EC-137]